LGARVVLSFDGAIVRELELDKAVVVIGRHPDCDLCIDHPAISARHLLLRTVGRTVYVEDLASTNGTKVNGVATPRQVLHHLDLVEAGRHKLHFFDDTLLAGGVSDLEKTVHTDFERTLMVASMAAPAAPATPAALAAPAATPRRAGEDLSRTMAIPRAQAASEPTLALRLVSGTGAGEAIALRQANTMLGAAGADTALVVKRGDGFFITRFGGSAPRLNARELGPGAHPIAPRDVIEVGAVRYEVIQLSR
jgi:hypothetical protein